MGGDLRVKLAASPLPTSLPLPQVLLPMGNCLVVPRNDPRLAIHVRYWYIFCLFVYLAGCVWNLGAFRITLAPLSMVLAGDL